MYKFDMDQAEGRWSVEKFRNMATTLYTQTMQNQGKSIYMSGDVFSALHMCAALGFKMETKENYKEGNPIGWFCEAPIYLDGTSSSSPDPFDNLHWAFRTEAESLLV
jgi:hypothetical protein